MNWSQFKRLIEKQGTVDTDEISYIDLSGNHIPKIKRYGNEIVISAYSYNSITTEELEKIIDKPIIEIQKIISEI